MSFFPKRQRVDPLGISEIPQWSDNSHWLNSAPPGAMAAKPETRMDGSTRQIRSRVYLKMTLLLVLRR
jgi:hypothetical protein